MRAKTMHSAAAATALLLTAFSPATAQSLAPRRSPLSSAAPLDRRPPLRGIRFDVDTIESPRAWRGALSRAAGVVEFAAGRGRFSVTAIRRGPVVALNGVTVAAPLARPSDYYLFDTTGFILVRPTTRTFSSFVFTRAELTLSGGLLPGAFLMKNTPIHTDTLSARSERQPKRHVPIAVHWHLDSLDERGPVRIYARGWIELQDAPAIETGVARWFGVATALARIPGAPASLPRDGLQVTSVALLYPTPTDRATYARYLGLLRPLKLAAADVDPSRLMLPAGYRETRWPGFERAAGLRAPSRASATRWRTLSTR